MEQVRIEVCFGEADCKAHTRGDGAAFTNKFFDTPAEASAYVAGMNDANGYMECGVKIPPGLKLREDLNDLYFVEALEF